MGTGHIVALYIKPEKGQLLPVQSLLVEADKGIVGDHHYGRPTRQVLITSEPVLKGLGYAPGDLREQMTVDLPDIQELPPGATLETESGATFEIEQDCAPCTHMASRLGEDGEEFKARTAGKRGMLALVKTSGEVEVGDKIWVVHG